MCGIVGYLERSGEGVEVGRIILQMLEALGSRGPDSAGVALYAGRPGGELVLRVKLGEDGHPEAYVARVVEQAAKSRQVLRAEQTAEYLRLVVDTTADPRSLERAIETVGVGVEVVSMGRQLEIIKQVGSPQNLEATYAISDFVGTHGIGHTRLSTESRIDLSHSQPFWAHGHPDLAVVHNGHICNYHKLRRRYEQRGVHFYTENDSEIIGMYLGERLAEGMSLRESLEASMRDLDGSFSYLVTTPEEFGFAKDPFAFKPLLFAQNERFVAVATEEIALRAAIGGEYEVREAQAGEVRVWQR
ncbi:MAG: glutamine phosphoribosylpyrophosphate amidotransferase [Candidatus Latescibacteria bacterium]|nr:glutamine phosphoribosylpyrophosphate amidotransferase [Candidatus Latescibacterota bacterium]